MNKQNPPCLNCLGDYEDLTNGQREIIHSETCQTLTNLKQTRAWNITKVENAQVWESFDYQEQQRANYLSLARGRERMANQAERERVTTQETITKFQKRISNILLESGLNNFDPQILGYLEIIWSQRQDLTDSHIQRAVKFTRLGWTLKPEGGWRLGELLQEKHFLESGVTND